jgi:hypothetical protein
MFTFKGLEYSATCSATREIGRASVLARLLFLNLRGRALNSISERLFICGCPQTCGCTKGICRMCRPQSANLPHGHRMWSRSTYARLALVRHGWGYGLCVSAEAVADAHQCFALRCMCTYDLRQSTGLVMSKKESDWPWRSSQYVKHFTNIDEKRLGTPTETTSTKPFGFSLDKAFLCCLRVAKQRLTPLRALSAHSGVHTHVGRLHAIGRSLEPLDAGFLSDVIRTLTHHGSVIGSY